MYHQWTIHVCQKAGLGIYHNYIHTRKCRVMWGRAWASTYYGYTWIEKVHTEIMSWIVSVYECRLCTTLTWSDLNSVCIICTVCEQLAIDGRSITALTNKSKVPCVIELEPSPVRLLMLHSGSSPALPFTYWGYLLSAWGRSLLEKYLNVHLKFTVYGRKHASIDTYTHTLSPASVGLTQAHPKYMYIPDTQWWCPNRV